MKLMKRILRKWETKIVTIKVKINLEKLHLKLKKSCHNKFKQAILYLLQRMAIYNLNRLYKFNDKVLIFNLRLGRIRNKVDSMNMMVRQEKIKRSKIIIFWILTRHKTYKSIIPKSIKVMTWTEICSRIKIASYLHKIIFQKIFKISYNLNRITKEFFKIEE